jgi:hypothetical protein
MSKGYITRWKLREKPEEQGKVDYLFDSHAENAASWETKEEAEADCIIFDHHRIVIPSAEGGTHICSGFKVEQRAEKEFVVFCEAPFIVASERPGVSGS